jgi:two-component system, OmpR family, sensor histidine kinase VicK
MLKYMTADQPSDELTSTSTKVIRGTTKVVQTEVRFFHKTKNKADTYMNYTRPPLAITFEPIKKAFLDAKNRGVHLRYLTEITKENLSYCKELIEIVHELRHLDGIKGNYMVSESEYIAPLILYEHGKIASQAIYSNIKQVVEQEQYVFDNLWNKAILGGERIKEIEEGRAFHYETKVLTNEEEIVDKIKNFLETSNELLVCSGSGGLQLGHSRFLDLGKEIMAKSRRAEHKGIRLLTTIDRDTIELVKMILDLGVQIREIKNMPPMNFSITEKEVHATIEKLEGGEIAHSVLVSNEPLYVNHFHYIFEDLWRNGIDAKTRIASIEHGTDFGDIEVISNASRVAELYLDLVKNAQKEIMIMLPTSNAFLRQSMIGAIQLAKEAAGERDVKIRILMPMHKSTEQLMQVLTEEQKEYAVVNSHIVHDNIEVRNIEQIILDSHATILVVDKKHSLVIEIRDDSKTNVEEATGLSVYSNSKASVLSYLSLMENLWLESELHEQLKESRTRLELANKQLAIHDKMQQDFINIAAHELRTPIQPILGLSQLLRTKLKDSMFIGSLDIIIRNAIRLQSLTEDILDVQKIESNTLQLNKESLDLNALISDLVADYKKQLLNEKKECISLATELNFSKPIFLYADKHRLVRVIDNLLNNAVKFTKDGTIITTVKEEDQQRKLIVSVKDSGDGIDPDILPKLFSKFVTKSYHGTGLGLYICKGIVEAHGGKIWGENNVSSKGARFSFSLPFVRSVL